MVVWIKEYLDLTKETVRIWFKKNIELRHFDGTDYVKRDDIIVVSSNDKDVDKDLHNLYNVIVYEETIGIISNQIINYVNEYFDYYYIKNSIRQTKERTINTIVTGSSYGRVGVDEKSMLNAINLSLSSQDIYYSLKGIEKACEFNSTIKNIVVCCGYYYFYSDLSKSKNIPELYKIPNVYVPLFGNNAYHNCNILARKMGGVSNPIFDVEGIADMYGYYEYEKGYYDNEDRKRITGYHVDWGKISDIYRARIGYERATCHNKSLNRKLTYKENMIYLNRLAGFCNKKKINLLFVVTPATKYYRDYLNIEFKNKFYETLNKIEFTIHVLDLFDSNIFEVPDFIDADHLSEAGSHKLTTIINETLINMEGEK